MFVAEGAKSSSDVIGICVPCENEVSGGLYGTCSTVYVPVKYCTGIYGSALSSIVGSVQVTTVSHPRNRYCAYGMWSYFCSTSTSGHGLTTVLCAIVVSVAPAASSSNSIRPRKFVLLCIGKYCLLYD